MFKTILDVNTNMLPYKFCYLYGNNRTSDGLSWNTYGYTMFYYLSQMISDKHSTIVIGKDIVPEHFLNSPTLCDLKKMYKEMVWSILTDFSFHKLLSYEEKEDGMLYIYIV